MARGNREDQQKKYPYVKKIIMGDRASRLMFTYAMSQRLLQRALTTLSPHLCFTNQ